MDPYLGDIRLFGGNYAPAGWVLCDGRMLSIADNNALYAIMGTTYGGDGMNTFGVPDLRGRVPVGQGQGVGLTPRNLGQQFGTESVSLLATQIPSHSHSLMVSTAAGTTPTPTGSVLATLENQKFYAPMPDTGPLPETMNAGTVVNTGGNLPHNNIMSSTAMNYILCTAGVFPSRN